MGYLIEPRLMSCVYRDYPYVGHGLAARWFVFDEETGAVLANNGGKGYQTYQKAYAAYQWQIKGPPSIKVHQQEQEMLYEWSLKNKLLTDRLDRIAMHYEQEGKTLTPRHIKVLFDTQRATCPTDEEKFLVAYQNDFYKDTVLERREKQQRRAALREQWDLKKKFDAYADQNTTAGKLRDFSDKTAVILGVVKEKIANSMKDYEERPQWDDNVERARMLSYVSPVEVVSTGNQWRGHEWEIVRRDPEMSDIYDTFGSEGPSSVDRVMEREYVQYTGRPSRLSTETIVDPVTYQIVPRRTTRCTTPQEWRKMAGPPKKKKKKTIPPEKAPMTTQDWVGTPDEETAPKKEIPRVSKSKIRTEPEHANASISIGSKGKKQRPRPEGLPPKAEPKPKPPIKDRVRKKMDSLKEEWSVEDDEEFDNEGYEIPTAKEIFSQMKNSIKTFFSDVKNEADRQKAEEKAQKEARSKARQEKKLEKQRQKDTQEQNSDKFDFLNSVIPDVAASPDDQDGDSNLTTDISSERQDVKEL